MSSKIYTEIKKDIVELRIPPGSVLNERELVKQLGASRTPIREAIIKLTQENWLVTSDRCSVKVKDISPKTVKDIFQFREMFESFALMVTVERQEKRSLAGKLDSVVRLMENYIGNRREFIKADLEFHTTIVGNVNNDLLQNVWLTICDELTRIAIFSMDEMRQPEIIIKEHKEIIQALWEGKSDMVLNTLKQHYGMIMNGFDRCFANISKSKEISQNG